MSQSAEVPHYHVDPKTGEQKWVGPTRAEVAHWRSRCETLRTALEAVVAITCEGRVCEVANRALEKTL